MGLSTPPNGYFGTMVYGFLLGFGGAFGWALGNGLIAFIAGALVRGAHGG